jgi:hypothetical protein
MKDDSVTVSGPIKSLTFSRELEDTRLYAIQAGD